MIYDILVIGNGGAGLSAAIELKKKGFNVAIISKTNATSSQTVQAQGGINGVLNNSINDSVSNHIKDTYISSHNLGDMEAIKMVCNNANDTIKWLDNLGVAFNRDKEDNLAQRKMAGSSHPRTCYCSDYTGLKIIHTLYDTALQLGIIFLDEHILLNLIKEDNQIKGITALRLLDSKVIQFLAYKVIIATGGYAGVYFNHNTNSSGTTSDGIVAAYKSGAILKNMEFIQFHPTALKDKYVLISEAARAEGGKLVLKDGTRFTDELLPRDIVAREIFQQIQKGNDVFLDLRELGYSKIKTLIPQEYKLCFDFKGIKIDKELIPIIPAAHYSMGGIKIDYNGKTNIKNLYAIGECSVTGVHGANRLGGNSLLEIITYGINIAKDITIPKEKIEVKQYTQYIKDTKYIETLFTTTIGDSYFADREDLGKLVYDKVGLYRDEKNLLDAQHTIKLYANKQYKLNNKSKIYNIELKELLEFNNMIITVDLIIQSALYRQESRGSHTRLDFPNENDKLAYGTLLYKNNNKLTVGYENEY